MAGTKVKNSPAPSLRQRGIPRGSKPGMAARTVVATHEPTLLRDLTLGRPDLTIEAYPAGHLLLLRCAGATRGLEQEPAWASPGRRVLYARRELDGTVHVLLEGTGEAEALARLAAEGLHVSPPVLWKNGEALVTLQSSEAVRLDHAKRLFPHARIAARRTGPAGSKAALLPTMTAKQARALLAAHERGYYSAPRRATTRSLAKTLGLARSTFEQHLKRAEAQVVEGLLPLVRLRAVPASAALEASALQTHCAYSSELALYVVMQLRGDAIRRLTFAQRPPPAHRGTHPHLEAVLRHLRTGREDLRGLPLDLDPGGFDRAVYDALREIPAGATITYRDLARRAGAPNAARAAGNACARNPVLVVIPCHRVVPAAGGLGNYSGAGGPRTKKALLGRESGSGQNEPR